MRSTVILLAVALLAIGISAQTYTTCSGTQACSTISGQAYCCATWSASASGQSASVSYCTPNNISETTYSSGGVSYSIKCNNAIYAQVSALIMAVAGLALFM